MHPRNIYNKSPNFKELAITYPELSKYIKIKLSGRAEFDFKNEKAVAALTKTLLLKDFNLIVDVPWNKLVPTLPLRLNYILWVEDLLNSVNIVSPIQGIDIGTGASCIYPLLASKNKWQMVATEVLKDSAEIARRNIERNSLTNMITVIDVDDNNKVLKGVINENEIYSFCMCNPPFFAKMESVKNRNNRPPSKHARTGSGCELETDGGELAFIKRLIEDSVLLGSKISVYTTMVGKKCNLSVLRRLLQEHGVKNIVTTEFVQGKTLRWGLAWSFTVTFPSVESTKSGKMKVPVCYALPEGTVFQDAVEKMKELLKLLKVSFEIENDDPFTFNVTAFQNTWSNQRRKRRALRDVQDSPNKKPKANSEQGPSDEPVGENNDNVDETLAVNEPILEFILKLIRSESSVSVEACWLSGTAGKEGMHQVLQFMKNKWLAT